MTKRLFSLLLLGCVTGCTGWKPVAMLRAEPSLPRQGSPDLLVIISDDLSAFCLGVDGDRRGATPHLDRLAREGVYFTRAYCNSPLCTPSRQSFLTGMLPHAAGVTRLDGRLSADATTLGTWLKAKGYRTAAYGKMHFNGPARHGFDTLVDLPEWERFLQELPPEGGDHRRPWRPFLDPPEVWLNAACQDDGLPAASTASQFFVDRAIARLREPGPEPLAMVVSLYEPHSPFRFPREWRGRFRSDQFAVPPVSPQDRADQPNVFRDLTPDQIRGIQAAYYTSASFADHQIGRLMTALDATERGRATLVVFFGDNGYLLGEHGRFEKNCFYEQAVRVPLIVRWPGHLPTNARVSGLTELVDLFPTVCRLLDVPPPPGLQGMDLVPLIEGKAKDGVRSTVFSTYPESEEAMVRTARYKLVVGAGRRARHDHLETGRPPGGPYLRLYDLERDPDETTDLSDAPALRAERDDLIDRMYQRLVATWTGPRPIPPGLTHLETIHWCLAPRDRP